MSRNFGISRKCLPILRLCTEATQSGDCVRCVRKFGSLEINCVCVYAHHHLASRVGPEIRCTQQHVAVQCVFVRGLATVEECIRWKMATVD